MKIDDEKLILLVKQNEMLYNKENPLFKHPDKKREVWQKIAKEMEIREKACIKRWTSLCDAYALEWRKMKNEKDFKPSRIFIKRKEFLRPPMTPIVDRQYHKKHEFKQLIKSSSESDNDDDSINSCLENLTLKGGYTRSIAPKKSKLRESLIKMRDNPFLPQNPTLEETLLEFDQEEKRRKRKEENSSVYAFADVIVAIICSMQPRNRVKAMKKAADIIMKIKLEEE